uniref:Protein kinase domain-containing protein n=1 Tax=Biomphalaria glabrata TaxID=6526 RepID=A0A2C9LCS5_BIOGL
MVLCFMFNTILLLDSPSLTKDDHFDLSKLLAKQTATQPLLPSEFEEPPQEEEPEAVIVNASPDSVYNIGELLYKCGILSPIFVFTNDTLPHEQVLHGLEYLQRSSLLHLNLQPASIVVSKIEGFVIQLTDFSLATKLTNPVGELVPRQGYPDFIAPEVVIQDLSGYPADVWSVGVLSFLLLSGVSPYEGKTPEETLVNISLNRYDAADLFENVTAEGLKFLFKVLKRTPGNRMTVQECLDHKWLQLADKHIKERENTVFLSNALSTFVREYDARRQSQDFKMDFDDAVLPIQMAKRS